MSLVRWCWRVVAWAVCIGAVAVLTAAVLVPRLGGATPYTVLTGSMRPSLPPGTLAVVKPVPLEEIGIGSVVTYQLRSGEPAVVTHRVIEVGSDLTGARRWRTQGDANDVADAAWVRPEQIRGEVWYAVPRMGYVASAFDPADRELAARLIGVALLVYAGVMFTRSIRRTRRAEVVSA